MIDADYRGEIGIVIFNHYKEDFVVKYGDRVAQLIIERIMMPVVVDATVRDKIILYTHYLCTNYNPPKYTLKICLKLSINQGLIFGSLQYLVKLVAT